MRKLKSAVELGRKGGLKGGAARAAGMTPAQRSASASKAVRARWAKAGKSMAAPVPLPDKVNDTDASDLMLASLLNRLKASTDLDEVRRLSERIERIVFRRQFANA